MNVNKDLVLAMLAGAKALRRVLSREGGTTYVLDPFNTEGKRAEISYAEAEILLRKSGMKIMEKGDTQEVLNISVSYDGNGRIRKKGRCPSCKMLLHDEDEAGNSVHFCFNCGQKVGW